MCSEGCRRAAAVVVVAATWQHLEGATCRSTLVCLAGLPDGCAPACDCYCMPGCLCSKWFVSFRRVHHPLPHQAESRRNTWRMPGAAPAADMCMLSGFRTGVFTPHTLPTLLCAAAAMVLTAASKRPAVTALLAPPAPSLLVRHNARDWCPRYTASPATHRTAQLTLLPPSLCCVRGGIWCTRSQTRPLSKTLLGRAHTQQTRGSCKRQQGR